MAERDNMNPKAHKFSRDSRRTARRRRNLPESQEPKVEEDKGEKQTFGEKFVLEKVHEFFEECGVGERGFITREDMQKLQQKFPFSSEELEMVFDKLDVDNIGILTPEQLTEGLSHFLSDQGEDTDVSYPKVAAEPQYPDSHSSSLQDQVDVEDEEKQQFATLMEKLGAAVIFQDKSEIWKLWIQLRRNEPNLLGHLEDFLSKVTGQIQDTLHEKEDLERTLKKKMVEHNADTQRLYEEMELQINNEKERIKDEIVVRFQAQNQDLQKELDSKQDEVQHQVQMQAQLQAELVSLRSKQDEASTENQELKMSNQEMALQVEGIQQELQEARDQLVILKEEAAHREERDGEWRQSLGLEGPRSEEAVQQLQAELVSLRSKHDEISTENQELKCLNQKLETGMEGIQAELQEARDRLEGKNGESNQTPDKARLCSEEADQQFQAELESLRSKQDETNTENQELHLTNQELEARLEGIQQELQEARDRLVSLQEEAAHREEREGELDSSPGSVGPCSEEAFQQLQAELMSLRSKQDETGTENQELHLTNQELEARLEGIQNELQETRDRLVSLQEEAAHREEREGELDPSSGSVGPGSEETIQKLQAELVSLRSKEDETSTENQELHLTNQELEARLEGIRQELQEARDRLVILQEEAAHREEGEGELDRTPGTEGHCSEEAIQQLQAELVSLRSKQDETGTENQELKLTNREMKTQLEGIQQKLQEAQDQLVILQEEKEKGEDQLSGSGRADSDEVVLQLQAELVSLRSKQDETSTENQKLHLTNQELEARLEGIQQELQEARDRLVIPREDAAHQEEGEGLRRTRSTRRRGAPNVSGKPDALGDDPHLRVEGHEVILGTGGDGDRKETAASSGGERAAERIKELQAELMSLRSKQDETSTENQELHLTNQKLEARLEGIQQELQEARDRLVMLQEDRDGVLDRAAGSGGQLSEEGVLQLQAELVSLRSKQDKTSTENQELEARLEGIQQELQEARDRLVILQEETAHREERDGALERPPGSEGELCHEDILQLQAELESLRSKQDETSTENQELHLTNQELEARLEGIQQELQEARDRLVGFKEEAAHRDEGEGLLRTRSIRRRVARDTSGKPDTPGEDPHLRVEGPEVTLRADGDGDREETAAATAGDGATETTKELQAELESLRSKQDETSTENQELHLTNQELKTQLEGIQQELQEARDRLVVLQEEATRREEGEGLQRTRSIRRRGTRDTSNKPDTLGAEGQAAAPGEGGDGAREKTAVVSSSDGAAETIKELQAELESLRSKQDETSTENQALTLINQELEARLAGIHQELQEARAQLLILQEEATHREAGEGLQRTRSIRRRVTCNTSRKLGTPGDDPHLKVEGQEVTLRMGDGGDDEETAAASAGDGAEERSKKMAGSKDPDQVYNIMFVGNSNCGKTSFIQHFCDGSIQPGLSSTVGIDYRVKTLMVGDRHVALQLWDSAGQERYHCVTKQYFRKADGVIVMYDIASSSSFSRVHYWLSCVKEATSDDVCILLLGNKVDDTAHRQVSKAEGEQLAQDYNILFYECSAHTGQNIIACIEQLSKSLKQQEERIQGKTVELVKKPEKKRCC